MFSLKLPVMASCARLMRNKNLDSYYSTVEQLKSLPIDEVFHRYIGGELRPQGERLLAQCPFHSGGQEKTPSLALYTNNNSWYCFACQSGGSNIDLVMQLNECDFKEATRVLITDFKISESVSVSQKAMRINLNRKTMLKFQEVVDKYYIKLATLYRSMRDALDSIESERDLDRYCGLYHIEPVLEHVLDVLQYGDIEEKLNILKNTRVRWWYKWQMKKEN